MASQVTVTLDDDSTVVEVLPGPKAAKQTIESILQHGVRDGNTWYPVHRIKKIVRTGV